MVWLRKTKYGRWVLAGLVASVGAGAFGVVQMTSAAPNNSPAALVPITPCRLFDTRSGADNVGSRSNPVGPGETFMTDVWGANGRCSIPTTATAVALNVTFVNPTADSVLTVYPADAPLPAASNLNWLKGQAPTPNAVTVALSANGQLAFWNLFGTVDVIADVAGYYQPGGFGAQGPKGDTGARGDAGTKGDTGAQGAKGDAGAPGPQGPKGEPGATNAWGRVTTTPTITGTAFHTSGASGTGPGRICVALTINVTVNTVVVATIDGASADTDYAGGVFTEVEAITDPALTTECPSPNSVLFLTGRLNLTAPTAHVAVNEPFHYITASV